uniref:Uncharacterized protein n=1 Tax=Gadus morhua TaxID=8049 RepID=A0A8C5BEN3_GADMO
MILKFRLDIIEDTSAVFPLGWSCSCGGEMFLFPLAIFLVVSTFHPFQWRNWTPQAMLYLKGASKLPINLVFRPVAYKQNEATVPYF